MCDHAAYTSLEDRVDGLEARLTSVESVVSKMRSECQAGFLQVNAAVTNLASEFGTRMNTIDKRLVDEKAKWGDTIRTIVIWTARIVLGGAAVAMGVTTYVTLMK